MPFTRKDQDDIIKIVKRELDGYFAQLKMARDEFANKKELENQMNILQTQVNALSIKGV